MENNLWKEITEQAEAAVLEEPSLASLIHETILSQKSFAQALAFHLADKLRGSTMGAISYNKLFLDIIANHSSIIQSAEDDLKAIRQRDAACECYLLPFLYYKGFLAIQVARMAHALWQDDRKLMALHLQSRSSEVFATDIHPACKIGHGILLDHATSFVAGETAVIGNNVSILHEVTLGGSGKTNGDRHPKVGDNVLIGAGAKLIGNIKIGTGVKIGAGSVVLDDVREHTTVVGVPAKEVGRPSHDSPASYMEHKIT